MAVLVNSTNDMLPKIEHNVPKQKFRNLRNDVSHRIGLVKCFLLNGFVRHLYVYYKTEHFNDCEARFTFITPDFS